MKHARTILDRWKLWLVFLLMRTVANGAAQSPPDPPPSTSVTNLQESTRIYRHVADRDLELWMVKPTDWKATDQRPALVFYHGGGWTGGTPAQFHPFARHLAQRGMVAFSVQYRLLSKTNQDPPMICIEDAKAALRWVRSRATELGVDPKRIGAGGGSAGGQLAAVVGMIDGLEAQGEDTDISSKANALILFNPVLDNGPGGWGHARVKQRYREFSPFHNVSADDPPTLVLSGSEDALIPAARLREFQARLNDRGARCEVEIYAGESHGFFNQGRGNDHYFHLTRDRMDTFLTSLGWLAPRTPGKDAGDN